MLDKTEIQKARVYLAGPFFSPEQIDRVERVEKALENNPFVEAYFSPRLNQVETLQFGSKEWRQAVFAQDINNIDLATVVVAIADMEVIANVEDFDNYSMGTVTDSHADDGTAFELGYAYAKGIPVIVLQETDLPLNLMISDSLHAYFTDVAAIEDYNFLKMPESKYTGEVI